METEIKIKKTTDNICSLRNGLNTLINRTTENEIVIKPTDKGSIITVISPEFYLNVYIMNAYKIMTLLLYLKTE